MESVNKSLYLAYKNTNFGAKSSAGRSALVYPLNLGRLPLRPQLPVELPGNVQGQLGEADGLQVAEDGDNDAVGRVALCVRVFLAAAIPGNDEEDAGSADAAAGVEGTKFLAVQVKCKMAVQSASTSELQPSNQ